MTDGTSVGTQHYRDRFPAYQKAGFYRDFEGLQVSSLGLGTYLGETTEVDDVLYTEAVETALLSGINLIDSAINYRCMRSERNIGQALRKLIQARKITREEVVVCTKGGFLPFDGKPSPNLEEYFQENYVRTGVCVSEDLVAGCHCMTPSYLRHQVGKSLQNLGLESIDLYYVHNPETQLDEVPKDEFLSRLEGAFAELEKLVVEGKLKAYGTATWNGYRNRIDQQEYLPLHDVLRTAERAAGNSRHHFRAIQLPYNLGMPEAFILKNQTQGEKTVPILEAAQANGITVFTSASILQSRFAQNLPAELGVAFPGFKTDAARAIQFVRSTPGITAALVGMKRKEHVVENLEVAEISPAPPETLQKLFR
jgi:aryl-alcohol dehydrogenase-like predicted oxidoreductase